MLRIYVLDLIYIHTCVAPEDADYWLWFFFVFFGVGPEDADYWLWDFERWQPKDGGFVFRNGQVDLKRKRKSKKKKSDAGNPGTADLSFATAR